MSTIFFPVSFLMVDKAIERLHMQLQITKTCGETLCWLEPARSLITICSLIPID